MGSSGPLDHPELRDVERLLDAQDVTEAQRLLAQLGTRSELSDGVAYLSARLLHARGRLDLTGVADRLRDLLARSPNFPEAAAFLVRATDGRASRPSPPPASAPAPASASIPARPSAPASAPARASAPAPASPSASAPATVRASPKAPEPGNESTPTTGPWTPPPSVDAEALHHPSGFARGDLERGPEGAAGHRGFTAISGFDTFVNPRVPTSRPPDRQRNRIPDIPRAPALPQFRDNTSPPSYAPHRLDAELEVKRSKSLLPRNAGRYSEAPGSPELIGKRTLARPSGTASRPPPSDRKARETVPGTPDRIRSGMPPGSPSPLPTLFDIASWIDEGRHRDAIAAINRAGPEAGLEYSVLRARALAGAGYLDQALDALEKLEALPQLDAELRAACARLFVELGDPTRALRLARRALDADPDRPLIRLTYALAAVRLARRKPDEALLDQADRALERLQGREGPLPALLQALKACIQAGTGDPERAISIAQRALGLDPRSPDALAAVAEASARLGRSHDARQAWARLSAISPDEGEAVAGLMARAGVVMTGRGDPVITSNQDVPPWTPVELELASGNRTQAMVAVEQSAHDAARRMSKSSSQSGITAMASIAASFLTTAPVLSSFAPYDMSLWSVRRLDAALDVLYGIGRRPRLPTDDAGLVLLLGAYLGEALRLSYNGNWEGSTAEIDGARAVASDGHWYPFRILATRLRQGRRAALGEAIGDALTKQDPTRWRSRIPNPVVPQVPWAPAAWPRPSQIGALGRSLVQSPVGKYCQDYAEGPLDSTTASLIALDTYLDLVAPPEAAADTNAAWTRRISVFAGGYVGETIRELVGGSWIYGIDSATDALSFKLQLRGTVEATPVAHVLERVIGERTSSLVDYAKTLMRRAGRG